MPVHAEKVARYAKLTKRLAASKARAVARRGETTEDSEKENNAPAPVVPVKKSIETSKLTEKQKNPLMIGSRLTKEQKNPQMIERARENTVDPELRRMLSETEKDPNTRLTGFQVALVERIEAAGELSVLELCYMIWEKAEITQAGIGGKDLPRIVRNAIRVPKAAGIIAHSGTRGSYVFKKWTKAKKTGRKRK